MSSKDDRLVEVRRLCFKCIEAAFAAKAEAHDEQEFYENDELNRTSNALSKAIRRYCDTVGQSKQSAMDALAFVSSYMMEVWDAAPEDKDVFAKSFATDLIYALETPSPDTEWLAILPLERRFEKFDEYVDLGDVAIINSHARNSSDTASAFMELLGEKFGVTFMNTPDVAGAFVLARRQLELQSSGTIPHYPQLVARLGTIGEVGTLSAVSTAARRYLPLLACCAFLYDCISAGEGGYPKPPGVDKMSPHSWWSIGKTIRPIAFDGLALNVRTGAAFFQDVGVVDFEVGRVDYQTRDWLPGERFNPDKFLKYWNFVGRRFLRLEERLAGATNRRTERFSNAIHRALRLLAKCKYSVVHHLNDSVLFTVIATETILDPFDTSREGLAERFAVFGSALAAKDPNDRRRWYDIAKELYLYRSKAGHQSMLFDAGEETKFQLRDAVVFFYRCLLRVYQWAEGQLKINQPVSKATFEQFYRTCVLGPASTTEPSE